MKIDLLQFFYNFFILEINTNRLTIEELKKQLEEYGIDTDISNNRVVLAEILQNKLNDETLQQNTGKLFLTIKSIKL